MAENSAIEWTDATFNPWIGCTRISPGCDHCYAAAQDKFRGWTPQGWGGPRRRTSASNWRQPLAWDRRAAAEGRRMRVFCASLADVFDNQVQPEWRADLFELIDRTPNLDWLLLTKRIGNVPDLMRGILRPLPTPLPANVWLGATVVNQEEADRDIPKLLLTPAAVRFLSMEPLLGSVDLRLVAVPADQDQLRRPWDFEPSRFNALQLHDEDRFHQPPAKLDWVIVGGESGSGARPMHPDWARSLRDQCAAAGVPFLFKQWGEFLPASADAGDPAVPDVPESRLFWSDGSKWDRFDGQRGGVDLVARIGKKAAGRLLDGRTHDGFPAFLELP